MMASAVLLILHVVYLFGNALYRGLQYNQITSLAASTFVGLDSVVWLYVVPILAHDACVAAVQ